MSVIFLTPETERLFNDPNKKLYRVMKIDRLLEILETSKWAFVSPDLWADPYEKAFLLATYSHGGKKFSLPFKPYDGEDGLEYKLFSMCWTETMESEAFWHTYAPNGDGVGITVNAKELKETLNNIKDYDVYLGQAQYEDFDKLYNFKGEDAFWRELKSRQVNVTQLKLMLKKRLPFEYEKEVRILLMRKDSKLGKTSKLLFKKTKELILSYTLDPRLGEYLAELLMTTLSNPPYSVGKEVTQSTLYRKPSKYIKFQDPVSDDYQIY